MACLQLPASAAAAFPALRRDGSQPTLITVKRLTVRTVGQSGAPSSSLKQNISLEMPKPATIVAYTRR